MWRRIRNLLGLPANDTRAMGSGTAVAGVAGAVIIVAAVTAGISSPSGAAGPADPGSQVDVVEDGLEESLQDTNDKVVSKDEAKDSSPRRQFAAKLRQAIPDHAWSNMPSETREQLTLQVGGFMTQVEAQASVDSELTQVRSAGEGIVRGATLKQHGTGAHTITDQVQETYTEQKQVFSHWDRYISHYDKELSHWERVPVGTKQVRVGTSWERKMVQETYEVPVYDTRTVAKWETKTVTTRVRESRRVYDGYSSGCYSRDGSCSATYTTEYYWTTETTTKTVKTFEEERYVSGYETHTRFIKKTVEVPIYETRTVYDRDPVYDSVPVYDQRAVYDTVNIEKTRTKTVEKTVHTAPFVVEDNTADWTLAEDITEYRDATMRIERTDLTEDKSDAFELVADSQESGEEWRMSVWKDTGEIVIETNNGIQRRAGGDFVNIDFGEGTINGEDANLRLARDIDSAYDLEINNGNQARGTYRLTVDGDPSIEAQTADIASDEAGVTVVDGVVYSATFDVTYDSQETTYTDRITIEPTVNLASEE